MNFWAHFIIALVLSSLIFVGISYFITPLDIQTIASCILIAGIFGIVPDVDLLGSYPRGILTTIVLIIAVIIAAFSAPFSMTLEYAKSAVIFFLAILGVYFLILEFIIGKHRSHSHTLVFGVVIALIFYYAIGFPLFQSLAVLLGVGIHLILDKQVKVA